MSKKRVIVIGAGIGGLSTATSLAQKGYKVTVLEKNESAGGRASLIEKNGYKFDIGPSWYMMPEIFDRFFKEDLDRNINDYLDLKRLDPSYKIYFEEREIRISADLNKNIELFESIEEGAGDQLKKFLDLAEYKYTVGMRHYVYTTFDRLWDFFDFRIMFSALRLNLFSSLHSHVSKYFQNHMLRKVLEFMVVFIGGSPKNVPALYSLLSHTDFNLGIWYPMGGMYKLVEAFVKVGNEQGIDFKFNEEVQSIGELENGNKIVKTNNGEYEAEIVVANADYHHVETKLLDKSDQTYSEDYWDKKTLSPSSLLFFLGINKKLKNIEHHTLFMDKDWDKHFGEIFDNPKWPENPLYYTCVPSITDPKVAPKGKENLMILIPISPGLEDTEEIRQKYLDTVIKDMERQTKQEIKNHIEVQFSFGINDFQSRYNAFKGNAFGLAHTLFQTAIFRPKYKSKRLKNLYYTGHFTVPGVGVPMVLISGKIIADKINKIHG